MDEIDLVLEAFLDLLGDVDDGAAYPTLAELWGRKQEGNRFLPHNVREVNLVLGVGRDPRRDFREVSAVSDAVGVWITGAWSPTRGIPLYWPTIALGRRPAVNLPGDSSITAAIRHSPSLGKSMFEL